MQKRSSRLLGYQALFNSRYASFAVLILCASKTCGAASCPSSGTSRWGEVRDGKGRDRRCSRSKAVPPYESITVILVLVDDA